MSDRIPPQSPIPRLSKSMLSSSDMPIWAWVLIALGTGGLGAGGTLVGGLGNDVDAADVARMESKLDKVAGQVDKLVLQAATQSVQQDAMQAAAELEHARLQKSMDDLDQRLDESEKARRRRR